MKIKSDVSNTLLDGKIILAGTEFDMPTAQARVLLRTGLYERVSAPAKSSVIEPEGQSVEQI